MAKRYILLMSPENDEAFRNLVKFYPAGSYDKWLYLQAKEIERIKAVGDEPVEVEVTPDEFIRYCDRTGAQRNINTLRALAFAKGSGKAYPF